MKTETTREKLIQNMQSRMDDIREWSPRVVSRIYGL